MEGAEHSSAFSAFGSPKDKLVLLGAGPQNAALITGARSFSIEHVSPALLVQQEISRRTSLGQQAHVTDPVRREQLHLAVLRKWFWARKPDAGFLLEGFPATLLQAKVFDEWLDARGEVLTVVIAPEISALAPATAAIVTHYRTLGLLHGATRAAARQDLSLSKV